MSVVHTLTIPCCRSGERGEQSEWDVDLLEVSIERSTSGCGTAGERRGRELARSSGVRVRRICNLHPRSARGGNEEERKMGSKRF
jgi:hypothetical protein